MPRLLLEDPGLSGWAPAQVGAAGMREAAELRARRDTPGFGGLRVEIIYDDAKVMIRCAVEISDGIIYARYVVNAITMKCEDEPVFRSEDDGSCVTPSDGARRFLSLDRHASRIDQLLDDILKHDEAFGHRRTRTLLDNIGLRKPRSRRGRGKLIRDNQLAELEAEKLPIGSIAAHLGVTPKAIYEHRRRRRIEHQGL